MPTTIAVEEDKSLRRLAKDLKRSAGIPLQKAQDLVAQKKGYRNWSQLQRINFPKNVRPSGLIMRHASEPLFPKPVLALYNNLRLEHGHVVAQRMVRTLHDLTASLAKVLCHSAENSPTSAIAPLASIRGIERCVQLEPDLSRLGESFNVSHSR